MQAIQDAIRNQEMGIFSQDADLSTGVPAQAGGFSTEKKKKKEKKSAVGVDEEPQLSPSGELGSGVLKKKKKPKKKSLEAENVDVDIDALEDDADCDMRNLLMQSISVCISIIACM
jgi:hypothetical protein